MATKQELYSRTQASRLAERFASREERYKRQQEAEPIKALDEETGPVYVISERDTSSGRGIVDRIARTLPVGTTKEEAEQISKQLRKDTGSNLGVKSFSNLSEYKSFEDRTGGITVVKTRSERATSQAIRKQAQTQSAINKAAEGEKLSSAEKNLIKGVEGGKAFLARTEAFQSGVKKLEEGKKLTPLEISTIGEQNVRDYSLRKGISETVYSSQLKQYEKSLKESKQLASISKTPLAAIQGSSEFVGPIKPSATQRTQQPTSLIGPPTPIWLKEKLQAPKQEMPALDVTAPRKVESYFLPASYKSNIPGSNAFVGPPAPTAATVGSALFVGPSKPKDLKIEKTIYNQNGIFGDYSVGLRSSYDVNLFKLETLPEEKFKKEINRQRQRDIVQSQRIQRSEDIFRAIPFLRGDNYPQTLTRKLLAFPTTATLGLGASLASASEKAFLASKGALLPSTRFFTFQELGRAAKETPEATLESFNPLKPSGAANIIGLGLTLGFAKGVAPKTSGLKLVSDINLAKYKGPTGMTILDISPVEFAAKTGKAEIRGTGLGKVFSKQVGGKPIENFLGKYKFITEGEKQPPAFTKIQSGGKILTKGKTTRGMIISDIFTQIKNKKSAQRVFTASKSKQVILGGEKASLISAGDFILSREGAIKPQVGRGGVLKKVGEVTKEPVGRVEYFRFGELGKSAKAIKEQLAPRRSLLKSKKAELLLERPKVKTPSGKIRPEAIATEQLLKGIRIAIERRAGVGKPRSFFVPLVPSSNKGLFRAAGIGSIINEKRGSIFSPISKKVPSLGTPQKPRNIFEPALERIPKYVPGIDIGRILTPAQVLLTELINPPTTKTPSIFNPPIPPKTPTPPRDPSPSKLKQRVSALQSQAKKESYNVEIRRGDKRGNKYTQVAKDLPRNKALQKLKNVVGNYIEAAGRIRPTGKTTKKKDLMYQPDMSQFRQPYGKTKLSRDTYVERRQFRLDSPNEVRQISYFKRKSPKKRKSSRYF